MNHTITTTLNEKWFHFLDQEAKRNKITKKSVIEKGLEYYSRYELEEQVKRGFQSRQEEYKDLNSSFQPIQSYSLKD